MTAEGSRVCYRCSAAKGNFLSVGTQLLGSRTIKTMDAWCKKITRVASGIDLPDILRGTSAQKIVDWGEDGSAIVQDQCQPIMRTVVRDAVAAVLIFSSTRSG